MNSAVNSRIETFLEMEPNKSKKPNKKKRKNAGTSFNWQAAEELDRWARGHAAGDSDDDVDYAGKMTAGQKRNVRLVRMQIQAAANSRTDQQVPDAALSKPAWTDVVRRGAERTVASTGTERSVAVRRDADVADVESSEERAAARGRRQDVAPERPTRSRRTPVSAVNTVRRQRGERSCHLQAAEDTMQDASCRMLLNQPAEEMLQPVHEPLKKALEAEHQQLTSDMETEKRVAAESLKHGEACIKALELELSKQKAAELEALAVISRVNGAITESLQRTQQLERCRGQQQEINVLLRAALTKAEDDLQIQRCQWQVEKPCLLQTLGDLTRALEDRKREEEEEEESRKATMDTVAQLEQQVKTIVSSKKKKEKKFSQRKRSNK